MTKIGAAKLIATTSAAGMYWKAAKVVAIAKMPKPERATWPSGLALRSTPSPRGWRITIAMAGSSAKAERKNISCATG
ncbi:MAG: hypothetical protein FJX69_04875 [Alphaproteobacteria bacterium]|nr:hypothetical protein [Alphaproteobacteria bacterium]